MMVNYYMNFKINQYKCTHLVLFTNITTESEHSENAILPVEADNVLLLG